MDRDVSSQRADDAGTAERMAAVLAIFHHARPSQAGASPTAVQRAMPSVFRLPSLAEAVATLANDAHPTAARFCRDARAVLGEAAAKQPGRADLVAALERIASARHATPPIAAADSYAEIADFDSEVTFDPASCVTRAEVRLRVRRSLADLALASDPRCWDIEENPFFRLTEKIDRDIYIRERRIVVDAHQPPAGTTWSGILYEEVECRYNTLALARFWNLLNVHFQVSPQSIHMRFSLFQSLRSRVWFTDQDGGIDVDSGTYDATPDPDHPGWTRIVAVKSVRYSDRESENAPFEALGGMGQFMNMVAPTVVGLWMVELTFWGACHVASRSALDKAFHSTIPNQAH